MTVRNDVSLTVLETSADVLFKVLNAHKVFGEINGETDGLRLEVEKRGFRDSVVEHALSGDPHYLELTYPSCVRLIIKTTINQGTAMFLSINAYDHPRKNEKMNYDALNYDMLDSLLELGGMRRVY